MTLDDLDFSDSDDDSSYCEEQELMPSPRKPTKMPKAQRRGRKRDREGEEAEEVSVPPTVAVSEEVETFLSKMPCKALISYLHSLIQENKKNTPEYEAAQKALVEKKRTTAPWQNSLDHWLDDSIPESGSEAEEEEELEDDEEEEEEDDAAEEAEEEEDDEPEEEDDEEEEGVNGDEDEPRDS